eukprot:7936320-Alexandrium_andersonii.AAC.1
MSASLVGSEMCIRDRQWHKQETSTGLQGLSSRPFSGGAASGGRATRFYTCTTELHDIEVSFRRASADAEASSHL